MLSIRHHLLQRVTELKMTAEGVEPVSLPELLARSDYLSIHPGLNETSRAMLSDDEFAAMKDTVSIINCGRGPTIAANEWARLIQRGLHDRRPHCPRIHGWGVG